jgi:putative transposase
MMETVTTHGARCGVGALCAALNLSAATYYRAHRSPPAGDLALTAPRAAPARALQPRERQQVLAVLHEPRFADLAPAQVYAALLDEGTYHCSERTMYRVLAAQDEVRDRRAQRRHPVYAAPELLAIAPNQLWSWDITKLKGPAKWAWYHLYVILDVFSRYVVGWMVAPRESAALAERLIGTSCERQGILRDQLTLHADRGSSMTSKPLALFLADLGVTKTHSRPHVSNDNPYSEAQFKTLKYRPDFPDRFGSIEHARVHSAAFFSWYNTEHRHSGLGLHTPHDMHFGLAEARRAARAAVLTVAYAATPERFVRRPPTPALLPTAAWINPPQRLAGPFGMPATDVLALSDEKPAPHLTAVPRSLTRPEEMTPASQGSLIPSQLLGLAPPPASTAGREVAALARRIAQ